MTDQLGLDSIPQAQPAPPPAASCDICGLPVGRQRVHVDTSAQLPGIEPGRPRVTHVSCFSTYLKGAAIEKPS